MKRNVAIAMVLLVAVVLGAGREFLFVNLNYAIDHLANHREVSYAHSAFRAAIAGVGLLQLIALKWVLAILFAGITLGLSILLARILFGDHRYRFLLVAGFAGVATVALLLQLASGPIPALGAVSVKLLHALQYPVVLLFLWASSLLQGRRI